MMRETKWQPLETKLQEKDTSLNSFTQTVRFSS